MTVTVAALDEENVTEKVPGEVEAVGAVLATPRLASVVPPENCCRLPVQVVRPSMQETTYQTSAPLLV